MRTILEEIAALADEWERDGAKELAESAHTLAHEDYMARREAVRALGEMRDPRAVGLLILALGDEVRWVSEAAVEALVRTGETAVLPLIEALGWPEELVCEGVRAALGQMGEGELAGAVLSALQGRVVPLAVCGDPRAVPPLLLAAGTGPVRMILAVHALACLGEPAVPALLESLDGGVLPARRAPAAARLRLGGRSGHRSRAGRGARGGADSRILAAVVRGYLGDAGALPALMVALDHPHARPRHAAARALARLGVPAGSALPRLKDLRKRAEGSAGRDVYADAVDQIQAAVREAPAEMEASAAPAGRGTELEAV